MKNYIRRISSQPVLILALLLMALLLAGCVIPLPPVPGASTTPPLEATPTETPILLPTPSEEPTTESQATTPKPSDVDAASTTGEVQFTQIPLSEPLDEATLEYSGMAWQGDKLVLLPQYPDRHGDILPTLDRDEIVAFLSGERVEPPTVTAMPFDDGGLSTMVTGFDGFEAIAFDGEQAYLTIETRPGNWMLGYVVAGVVTPEGSFVLNAMQRAPAPTQAALGNITDETLVIDGQFDQSGRLITIYEANGVNVNEQPTASTYSRAVEQLEPISFPNIEYRITDATTVDENRRFWAINYFFPGDEKLEPASDPIAERFGQGPSHENGAAVERLVEFQIDDAGISLVDAPPIQIELSRLGLARNWEGIVRLQAGDLDGFLLVTDKFPSTILAFVPRVGN